MSGHCRWIFWFCQESLAESPEQTRRGILYNTQANSQSRILTYLQAADFFLSSQLHTNKESNRYRWSMCCFLGKLLNMRATYLTSTADKTFIVRVVSYKFQFQRNLSSYDYWTQGKERKVSRLMINWLSNLTNKLDAGWYINYRRSLFWILSIQLLKTRGHLTPETEKNPVFWLRLTAK